MLAEFGTGQVFWSMLWFTLFFMWIWLVIVIFTDIFRSDDLSGWGKAMWTLFLIFLPYLGALVFMIARGGSMQERAMRDAQKRDQEFQSYVRNVTDSGSSVAGEVARLADLRAQGVLSDEEFAQAKAQALA